MTPKTQLRLYAVIVLTAVMVFLALPGRSEPVFAADEAKAMALMECETGALIAGKNADERLPMASTTKIMTALVVLENCRTDEQVFVPDEAVGVEGSSIYLRNNERISVEDLLYGLMLASGNDAAVALAVHVGGSTEGFAALMNKRAEELGLENTHFVTPNGLNDPEHYTTARELCMIARVAIKNDAFRRIVSTKYHRTQSGEYERTFKNKNSLLWSFDGAFGVKTGYTMAAGRCLVFGAERDGMTLVGALLNCRPMFGTASELLETAFDTYEKTVAVEKDSVIMRAEVENSDESVLEIAAKDSIIALLKKDAAQAFDVKTELYGPIAAPIKAGQTLGRLRVFSSGELIGETELVAHADVRERGITWWFRLLFKRMAA